MGPKDSTQVVRLGGKCLYLLNPPASLFLYILNNLPIIYNSSYTIQIVVLCIVQRIMTREKVYIQSTIGRIKDAELHDEKRVGGEG